jgi:hypothetical protein
MVVEIHPGSRFRCDHWKSFSQAIQKWLEENLKEVQTLLNFVSDGENTVELPKDKLLIQLMKNRSSIWMYPNEEKVNDLTIQYEFGSHHLLIWGIPDCPESVHERGVIDIFKKYLPLVIETDNEKINIIKEKMQDAIKNASREAFVKACSGRFSKLLNGTQKTIEDGHKSIQKLQIELTTKVREVKGAEQKLVQLEKARPDVEEGYRKEFQKFLSVPDIKKIEAGDGVIKVFTNMIYITHEKVKYKIGEFRIEIFINGGLKFFNLTNEGKGPGYTKPNGFNGADSYNRHHPHVKGDGSPCLGTISSAVPQLIGEYQYSVVAILAIQYLKSVNADDSAGQGIYWWPKVEEN